MERTISSEERIRRAEEIYNRRRTQNGIRVSTSNVSTNSTSKKEYRLFKRLILQICICLVIYFIFYLIRNSNYIFSEDVLKKAKEFLSYDINFENIYNQAQDYYNNNLKAFFIKENNEEDNTNIEQNIESNDIESTTQNQVEEIQGGIGGGEDVSEIAEVSADETPNTQIENKVELSQMEIDANDIKANCSFILPLKGTITSRYGLRTPTDIISANHGGIDIGVNEGTVFVAAMEGVATLVSGEGTYGNHIFIQNGDVTTVYAHCKTLYIKQGEKVQQGQKIGEVGSTGNATGPHLHFEVRKADRKVNPEYILAFE